MSRPPRKTPQYDLINPGVHGTVAGYRRHLRNNECPCDPCAAAAHEKEAAR